MYRCSSCGSDIDDGFDRCWNCNESVPGSGLGDVNYHPPTNPLAAYRVFRDTASNSDDALSAAASFASAMGRERVISISTMVDASGTAATVWFWSERQQARATARAHHVDRARERERELIILDPG
jgi:hypothetical protein